jgi:hypothetical protein
MPSMEEAQRPWCCGCDLALALFALRVGVWRTNPLIDARSHVNILTCTWRLVLAIAQ